MSTSQRLKTRKFGATRVWTMGSGDFLVVVHGGPGMDHTYLEDAMRPAAKVRRVVFYDQLACGRDRTPVNSVTAGAMVDQLVDLLCSLSDGGAARVSVLAHSWGAYALYGALATGKIPFLQSSILVSPVGLTRASFDASGERLVERIPAQMMSEIETLDALGDGAGLMRVIFPYYLSPGSRANSALPTPAYKPNVFARVMETVGDFDFRTIGPRVPADSVIIYGSDDIEIPAATRELHRRSSVKVLNGCGHFAFSERPAEFWDAVVSILPLDHAS